MSIICCSPTHSDPRSCACWFVVTDSPLSPVICLYCAEPDLFLPSLRSPPSSSPSPSFFAFRPIKSTMAFSLQLKEGESRRGSRLGLRKRFMRSALVTSQARSPTMVFTHGVVGGAKLLSNSCLGKGRVSPVNPRRLQTWTRWDLLPPLPIFHMLKTPRTNPAKADHQVSDLLIHWIYILNISPKLLGASP